MAMFKTSYRYRSSVNAAARLLLTPALALALGIGANGALFSMEGLLRSAGMNPGASRLLLGSDFQSGISDSAAPDDASWADGNCEAIELEATFYDGEVFACALTHSKKSNSIIAFRGDLLLLGGQPISFSFNQEGASLVPEVNVKGQ
jgi:hypothetical protein